MGIRHANRNDAGLPWGNIMTADEFMD